MIVRKIMPEEIKRADEIFNLAFEFGMSEEHYAKSPEEVYKDYISREDSVFSEYCMEKWAAFEDDDKTMTSFLSALPYDVRFDGHCCRMLGIGGVSTLPQYRRNGGIRGCFEHMLKDGYRNGAVFSYLYPFSTGYYRQFGYELGCERARYTINLRSYKRFDVGGKCCLCEQQDNMTEEIKSIYHKVSGRYNMSGMRKKDYDFSFAAKANPAVSKVYTYVYFDEWGEAKAYMTFKKVLNESKGFNMVCSDFMFYDSTGLKGLLNHALAFASYYDCIVFSVPNDVKIANIISEWALYPQECCVFAGGMCRAVNVSRTLELAKYRGSGEIKIEVADSCIPENNGVFEVVFKDGTAQTVAKVTTSPDISMGVNWFSRYIIGAGSMSELEYTDGIKILASAEKLEKVFYSKPCAIWEGF